MVDLNIDVTNIEPSEKREFPQLPEGWYSAYIDESEMKPTKDNLAGKNNNEYLQLRFSLMDWVDEKQLPPTADKISGRTIYTRLNIKNNNEQAVEIAYRDLSAIGHAVGVTSITSSELLHDKPLDIYLSETINNKNKPTNEINGYRSCVTMNELNQVRQAEANIHANKESQTSTSNTLWD